MFNLGIKVGLGTGNSYVWWWIYADHFLQILVIESSSSDPVFETYETDTIAVSAYKSILKLAEFAMRGVCTNVLLGGCIGNKKS